MEDADMQLGGEEYNPRQHHACAHKTSCGLVSSSSQVTPSYTTKPRGCHGWGGVRIRSGSKKFWAPSLPPSCKCELSCRTSFPRRHIPPTPTLLPPRPTIQRCPHQHSTPPIREETDMHLASPSRRKSRTVTRRPTTPRAELNPKRKKIIHRPYVDD